MTRLPIAKYVLSRILFHKSHYRHFLKSLLGDNGGISYFSRPAIRNKVIGNLMGIESWHQVLFGRPGRDYETAFLLACIAAAYDNAVDEEHFRDWPRLDRVMDTGPWEADRNGWPDAIGAARNSLNVFRRLNPGCWARALPLFKGISTATMDCFRQATVETVDEDRLRASTHDKGGLSFALFSISEDPELSSDLCQAAYDFGAASQIADDIYDREEDVELGQATLASLKLIRKTDRNLIDDALRRLPRHEGTIPGLLLQAWEIHLKDSLRFYDSGDLGGGWKFNIGQTAFRCGISMVPGLPRLFFRRFSRASGPPRD